MKQSRSLLLLLIICYGNCFAQRQDKFPAWALGPFARIQPAMPVITPDSLRQTQDPLSGEKVAWMQNAAFNPAAIVKNGKITVLFRAEDKAGVDKIGGHTSRIGMAESTDGIRMKIYANPVLYPGNDNQKEYDWPGGCEDPRVAVTKEGVYVMLYTSWNHKTPRLSVATSKDLVHWDKHGPAFNSAWNGRFRDMASKSASIVTQLVGNNLVITKINGKYLMYWGEHFVNPAVSDDLINWTPMLNAQGDLMELISPRKGFFDSDLTECGPPALLTSKGILLLYNGKNATGSKGDTSYPANSYCPGQVLFDKQDPTKVVSRMDQPFLYPTESYECSGQYAAGTVFAEGMVFYKKKWFLYYGCADSRVGVVMFTPGK